MRPTILIASLIGQLLLGGACWAYSEALPRNGIFPVGWFMFCWMSLALGGAQILVATFLVLVKKAGLFRWQLFLSGLLWLLIGGAVCGVPMLF